MRLFALSLLLIASENAAISQSATPRNACPVEDSDRHLIPGDIVGYCEVGEECWGMVAIVSADGKITLPLVLSRDLCKRLQLFFLVHEFHPVPDRPVRWLT
jgi:hypothetical protein